MKRFPFWLKAGAAILALVVLGGGAAITALKVFYPEPKLRAWAVSAARRQLGREVTLEHIGLGLGGVGLSGLRISERPDFAAGTFLSVDSFRLRPSWKALLSRKLVVAAVSADGLKVRVVKDAAGHFNFETLASTTPASEQSAPGAPAKDAGEAPPPELDVRRAKVSNATVEYQDRTTGASWSVTDAGLDLSDFSLNAPFTLKTSLRVQGKAGERPVDARLGFDGVVDLARGDRAAFKANVRRATVEGEGFKLTASGKAAGLDAPQLTFDASLAASGRTLLDAKGTAKLGAAVDVDLKAKTPGLDTRLIARFAPSVPALDLPPADLVLVARYEAGNADVKTFTAEWKGGKVDASGTARGLSGNKPFYQGGARFGVDVPEIKPGQYPFLKLPPGLTVPAGRVEGDVSAQGDDLKITSLNVKTKAGTASLSGTIRRYASGKPVPDAALVLALDLPQFKASELPIQVAALPPALIVPAARVDGTVRVSGDDVRLDKLTIKGKAGTIRLNGAIPGALAGAPQPDVDVNADLDLPALTDKDLPAGAPEGLRMPPSRWTADLSYSSRLIKIKTLRLVSGHNDLDISGSVTDPSGRGAFDLLLKCRSFALDELTALTPKTRDMKLSGSGLFALSVTGRKEKPIFAGKLQFKSLGATVAELPLSDFTGTVSFDERRIDVPNLNGKVGDGNLKLDLTVKDYAGAPEVQVEAAVDRFDLGRWLSAKAKVEAERKTAKAAKTAGKPVVAEEKPKPLATRGHMTVGVLNHPKATLNNVRLNWDLRGWTPDLRGLDGDAKLQVDGGAFHSNGGEDLKGQIKLLDALMLPLRVVQKIGPFIMGFPDFNNITLNQIVGDYGFRAGIMTLRQSEMDAERAQVSAKGNIDLPVEKLDLIVTAQVGRAIPVDVAVTGSFDNPKTKINTAKALGDGAKQLLQLLQKR